MEGVLERPPTGPLDVSWLKGPDSGFLTEVFSDGIVVIVYPLSFAVFSLCGFLDCFATGLAGGYDFAVACSSSFPGG